MNLIEGAIRSPTKTLVAVLFVLLFGILAVFSIPVQLTPTVDLPQVTVQTNWPGASPAEIEREIVDEQEEQLKGLDGLTKMESSSQDSLGTITLTFAVGSDEDANLLKVANRLEQVPEYPSDADKPIILTGDPNIGAVAWFVLLPLDRNEGPPMWTFYDFVDDRIKPEIERVPGVAQAQFFGGRERQMQVIVDPVELAARQLTVNQLAAVLDRENKSYSGGDFSEGKRRYVVRTVGEFGSAEEIADLVVAVTDGVPIYVRDVARVELGYRKAFSEVFFKNEETIIMSAIKEPGANVLELMEGIRAAVDNLNRDLLHDNGLELLQVYDETDYVYSSIRLVRQSLLVGSALAVIVLMLFLRSWTSTVIVALAIPISAVGTFLMMKLLGRTVNVISLAGMAFAVGMVVDNSIVVLENIYRHRQMGKTRFRSALDGGSEVWGAVLASTLTTIAVFVPILFVKEEAGQLFRDIALAISCGVGLSLVVAITVIPSLSARLLDADSKLSEATARASRWKPLRWLDRSAEAFASWVVATVYSICGSTRARLAVVIGFTVLSLLLSWQLVPKAEYLPAGNMNFVFGFVVPPPGYNLDEVSNFRHAYDRQLRYLWEASDEEAKSLPGGGLDNFFYVSLPTQAFLGGGARDATKVRELIPEVQAATGQIPGAFGFADQWGLFASVAGTGRNIDVEITGPDLEELIAIGSSVLAKVNLALPGAQAIPLPSLDLGNPEVRVRPDRRRAAEVGISNRELGLVVSALVDGAKASEMRYDGRQIDLVIKADERYQHRTHLLEQLPIATPGGQMITLGDIAHVEQVSGPVQINRRERQRTVTIRVTPPDETPLQAAMETIDTKVLEPLEADGTIGGLYRARLSGSADKLTQTRRALTGNFVLALVITYLLMAALFESFLYPFVIMFSVPLAALGGFLGLGVLNLVSLQSLDVLTMLGFIILVGTVVNNAILIVHQALNLMREGNAPREAIRDSTRTRIRPIFMSVSTSVCGMLPLVLFPGAGSELYRGLGSVVVGGLLVSTLFTLFLVPALFSLVLEAREALGGRFAGAQEPAA